MERNRTAIKNSRSGKVPPLRALSQSQLEIKVGPPRLSIHEGHTILVCEPDGCIATGTQGGLFFRDTRIISSWSVTANGVSWDLLNSGMTSSLTQRIYLTNREIVSEPQPVAAGTMSLVLTRYIDGGLREEFHLANHGLNHVTLSLDIAVESDFADIFEVKSGTLVRRGHISTTWLKHQSRLTTVYRNRGFMRKLVITAKSTGTPACNANGRISFEIKLPAGGDWNGIIKYELSDGERYLKAPENIPKRTGGTDALSRLSKWKQQATTIQSSNEHVDRLYHQAIEDIAALRLNVDGHVMTAAGLPWFIALFGRDSLISSIQSISVDAELAEAALTALGAFQATGNDDYRDAQPGKILHELRLGELAHLKLIPNTPYYGTADATPLYLITLHEAWRARGDRAILDRHLKTAEGCLEWIDCYGDLDGDGLQEYMTRSSRGIKNQGWKDSGDALVYPDGSQVRAPIATCEIQGYVYDAWLRMAEIYDVLGQTERAISLRDKASALYTRFNEAFWDEDHGFYAFALDEKKKKVLSVASNPGQCLWSGIVPNDRADRIVKRLMRADMWSGWGIRTLSANHPAFNPFSYQRGSIWPHDNSLIAMGFKRYGYAKEANKIAHDVIEAGTFFALNKMPELYAGLQREPTNFPVQYLGANVPQAWAAGAVFLFIQTILGLEFDARTRKVYVDPMLPEWMNDLRVIGLQVGEQRLDIQFWRSDGNTKFEVVRGDEASVVRRVLTPRRMGPRHDEPVYSNVAGAASLQIASPKKHRSIVDVRPSRN